MSNNNSNFAPQDSPESDFTAEQTTFELSDYFTFDQWSEDDQAATFFGTAPVYRANEVIISGGTTGHVEGPSHSMQVVKFVYINFLHLSIYTNG